MKLYQIKPDTLILKPEFTAIPEIYYGVPWRTVDENEIDGKILKRFIRQTEFERIEWEKIRLKDISPLSKEEWVEFNLSPGEPGTRGEMAEFGNATGIKSHLIWKDLKQFAKNIFFHIGEPFNPNVPDSFWDAFIRDYNFLCEQEIYQDTGSNYPYYFSIQKEKILQQYPMEWAFFQKYKDQPHLSIGLAGREWYLELESKKKMPQFIQFGNLEHMELYGYAGKFLLVKIEGKIQVANHYFSSYENIKAFMDKLPHFEIDAELLEIVGAISGSMDTILSPTSVLLYFWQAKLHETEKIPLKVKKHYQDQYYENLQFTSYLVSKDILTMVTWRSASDDYTVELWLNNFPLTDFEGQEYAYSPEYGFVKKT